MEAKELNEALIEACNCCPQFQGFDDDQIEIVKGHNVCVSILHEKGVTAVVRYWINENTIGGNLIHQMGYSAQLSDQVIAVLDRHRRIVVNTPLSKNNCGTKTYKRRAYL